MDGIEAVSVDDVFKSYRRGKETVQALSGVSLSVKEGEIFGLLGPNGAGKTSLISMLVGILSPDSGSATVFGKDCARQTQEVQASINVVSGFSGAPSSLSVHEALIYYSLLYSVKEPEKKVEELLRKMGLYESRDWVAEDLSSGMRQRFFICKGLLNDPRLLILDEPTVGLDVESAISVRKIVKELQEQGRTILLTTHNMFEAQELCDRIAFISGGKILATGTPQELGKGISGKRIIEIHCSDEKRVLEGLKGQKGVDAEIKSPQMVHVGVCDYGKTKDVLRALSKCEGEIYSVSELEPTLEEIYLEFMKNGKGDKNG